MPPNQRPFVLHDRHGIQDATDSRCWSDQKLLCPSLSVSLYLSQSVCVSLSSSLSLPDSSCLCLSVSRCLSLYVSVSIVCIVLLSSVMSCSICSHCHIPLLPSSSNSFLFLFLLLSSSPTTLLCLSFSSKLPFSSYPATPFFSSPSSSFLPPLILFLLLLLTLFFHHILPPISPRLLPSSPFYPSIVQSQSQLLRPLPLVPRTPFNLITESIAVLIDQSIERVPGRRWTGGPSLNLFTRNEISWTDERV